MEKYFTLSNSIRWKKFTHFGGRVIGGLLRGNTGELLL
jgi:hypothetical protein